jgi:hypothetical protein
MSGSDNFWRLESPAASDYQYSFVNGDGGHPLGLPGIHCSICRQTWSGSRVLPFECPPELRTHPGLQRGRPISDAEHRDLQQQLRDALSARGIQCPVLRPGDRFGPLEVRFPSHPESDFLWPAFTSVVVSQRVKDLFEEHEIAGVVFRPVVITKVGRRKATSRVPMPRTGEPEDIIHRVKPEKDPSRFGPLYEMLIVVESGRPPGAEITHVCPGCGRGEYDDAKREFVLTQRMIPATDVFYLATTLWIIVNEEVRQIILDNQWTNVEFTEMEYRQA